VLQVYILFKCLPVQAVNKLDRQWTYKCVFEAGSPNQCFRGKATSIKHFECVCGLVYLTIRLLLIILSSVACPTVPNFPLYLIKGTIFGKMAWNTKYEY
jgi:hypothetical protein